MAIANQERVGKSMEPLRAAVAPFVERASKSQHQARAGEEARRYVGDERAAGHKPRRALFDGDGSLDFDAGAAVAHVQAADPVLGRMIERIGPFRLRPQRTTNVFGALAEAIVYQQLNGKAAAAIYGRVCALLPRSSRGPTAELLLRLTEEELRAAGLSRPKLLALRDLARRQVDGEIPSLAEIRRMDDDAVIDSLTRVRGIGRWTVEMFLIFRLGRPDVLPVNDHGIRQGFAVTFGRCTLPDRNELEKRGSLWRPYRTVASWYLWRALERSRS